jgi:hypothetical protein
MFILIWCNQEKDNIISWKKEDNINTYKSIDLYINNVEKKEILISELKKYKDLIKTINIKMDDNLYTQEYLNKVLKYYKWNNFTFTIEWVKDFNIPIITELNINAFKKLSNQEYIYYWYNKIIKNNTEINKYKDLEFKNIKLLEEKIQKSWIKVDTFFLYGYPIRIKN